MKKEVRDGKVAVLFSPGFGAGWYSWHGRKELLFDPSVVYMVEQMHKEPMQREAWISNIEAYIKEEYGDEIYLGGAEDLEVAWLDEGCEFLIEEYDGSEGIQVKEETPWMKA